MLNPRVRRQARERALEFLFGLDFTNYEWSSALDDFWTIFPSKPSVRSYAKKLIQGVMENLVTLDQAISSALEHWSIDRIGYVERNVLRVALYEMRFAQDVPTSVAINEAIEVAKRYGPDSAPRFVNGVLDRLKEAPPRNSDL